MLGILAAISTGATSGSVAPVNTVAPVISGTPRVGQVLSCTAGTWTGNPAPSFTYQWKADGSDIVGETANTITLTIDEFDADIICVVTATNDAGFASEDSNQLGPVDSAPVNTAPPVVTGDPTVGETLSCSTGTWVGSPTITYAYQWLGDGNPISGATANTYELTEDEVGMMIGCEVTATNSIDDAAQGSNELGPVVEPTVNPDDIPDLLAWYDASDLATLWADAGGTIPATSTVARWDDKSGNGHHIVDMLAITGTKTINGNNALEFNGSSHYATIPSAIYPFISNATNSTMIITFAADNTTDAQDLMTGRRSTGDGGGTRYGIAFLINAGKISATKSGNTLTWRDITITADNDAHIAALRIKSGGASLDFYYDNLSILNQTSSTSNNAISDMDIGHNSGGSPPRWLDGAVAEVIFYSRNLTDQELTDLGVGV